MGTTSKTVDRTFEQAVGLLKDNCVQRGMKASVAYYNQVWARDSFISFLGANLLEDEGLLECARRNVATFARAVSPLGQVANFYDLETRRPEFGYSGSTDSSCWFIIGVANLYSTSRDSTLLQEPLEAAVKAYRWLRFQDANNSWLIDSPQGGDWMDAAVQRTGKTLYNNTLFLMASKSIDTLTQASGKPLERHLRLDFPDLSQRFLDVFGPGDESPGRIAEYWPRYAAALRSRIPEFPKGHLLQYVSFSRIDDRLDTFSNVLCILAGLCGPSKSRRILDEMRSRGLTDPFPSRVLDPPYRADGAAYDRAFDATLPPQHRSTPLRYHNGAVWPFVGGAHVCSMYRVGISTARGTLERLAGANSVRRAGDRIGFNEWLHGRSGRAMGQCGQSWNAGMFVAAVRAAEGDHFLKFLS